MVHVSEDNGWVNTTYDDNFYEATTSIEITGSTFEKASGNDTELYGIFDLPYQVTLDSLNVNLTMMAAGDCMATSFLSFMPIMSSGKVNAIRISIRNLAYTFASDWASSSEITSSNVFIRISGYGQGLPDIPDEIDYSSLAN